MFPVRCSSPMPVVGTRPGLDVKGNFTAIASGPRTKEGWNARKFKMHRRWSPRDLLEVP